MMNIRRIILLLLSFKTLSSVPSASVLKSSDQQYIADYLHYYGYLRDSKTSLQSLDVNSVSQGLKIFQGYWNLPADGTLNNETKTLMQTQRCGMPDDVLEYTVRDFKWNKKELLWYFHGATLQQIETAKKAFLEWGKITGLNFHHIRSKRQADIIISFGKPKHIFISDLSVCNYKLINETIAHAFFPNELNTVKETHLASDNDWEMGLGEIQKNRLSLYWVLLHEIGHTLGIAHSSVVNAIMFPFYRQRNNTDAYSFNYDDINAATYLYKRENSKDLNVDDVDADINGDKVVPPSVTTTETSVISSTAADEQLNADSICKVGLSHLKFFIFRKRMYVFYKKWAWPLNLDVKKRKYENPQLIRQWLTFLPNNFTEINAIYQRPSGDIALFSDNKIYVFNPDTLRLLPGWPKTYQSAFSSAVSYNDIQAAVLTNTGKTYIVYRGLYVIELDECTFAPRKFFLFTDIFKGIGGSNTFNFSFFKYTNGRIYLLQGNRYYEYDEYNGVLIKSDTFDLSLFDIECPIEDTVTKLKRLMSRLLFFYDKNNNDNYLVGELQRKEDHRGVNGFDTASNLRNYLKDMI